jgi:hypothetical protein
MAFLWLAPALGAGGAATAVLGSWPGVISGEAAELAFYRRGMGLAAPVASLRSLGVSLLGWLAVLGPLLALDFGTRARRGRLAAAVAAGLALAALATIAVPDWLPAARPLSLVVLATAVSAATTLARAGDSGPVERPVVRLALSVFALALLFKMLLNVRVEHYGFALAMPAAAVLAAALVGWAPAALRARGGGDVLRWGAVGLLAAAALGFAEISHTFYAAKTYPIGEGRDRMLGDIRARPLGRILSIVRERLPDGAEFLVLPEGVILNYWSRRRSPTPYVNFMPPELILFGERAMIDALNENPPDAVVLVHKPTHEYGLPFFGRDYGQGLAAWVEQRYRPLAHDPDRPAWIGVHPQDGAPLSPGTTFSAMVLLPKAGVLDPAPTPKEPAGRPDAP